MVVFRVEELQDGAVTWFRLMANPWMWFLPVVEELDLDVQAPFPGKFSYTLGQGSVVLEEHAPKC